MKNKFICTILFFPIFIGLLFAEQCYALESGLTNEDIRSFRLVKNPQLSPDGKNVAFETQEGTASGGLTHIWLTSINGKNARQITYSPQDEKIGEKHPWWMTNNVILFTSKGGSGSKQKLFQLSLTGENAVPLEICHQSSNTMKTAEPNKPCEEELDIEDYSVSPNGQWIAVVAKEPESEDEKKRKEAKNDTILIDQDTHRDWLWLYSTKTHSVQRVTNKNWDVTSVAWDWQSTRLAIITRPPGNADDLGTHHETWVYSLNNLDQPALISWSPLTASQLAWSPDGEKLAVIADAEKDAPPYSVADLYIVPLSKSTSALPNLNRSVFSLTTEDIPVWGADGKGIYTSVFIGTTRVLARFSLSGKVTFFSADVPSGKQFGTNNQRNGWVFVGEDTDKVPEIKFISSFSASVRTLTNSNPHWKNKPWSSSKVVKWRSRDGLMIEGILTWPKNSSHHSNTLTPLIVIPHGGPTTVATRRFLPFQQLLATQGWATFFPNFRGSLGYGRDFHNANKNNLGSGDYDDIVSGVDNLISHYPIDTHQLAVYGYSYGGEMAAFIEGKTDRFAAIVAGAPVINQLSEYGTEGNSWYDRWFYGQPWRHFEDAWRQSPLAYVNNAKTPFLLIHGQDDVDDPIGQSQEMYRALRQQGVKVALAIYPREDHATLRESILGFPSIEPWHGFDARERIVNWFQQNFALTPSK